MAVNVVNLSCQDVQPTAVVVYRDGAKLTRTAQISLAAGVNDVIISRLVNSVQRNSLRFELNDPDVTISWKKFLKNPANPVKTEAEKKLEELLTQQRSAKNEETRMKTVLAALKSRLSSQVATETRDKAAVQAAILDYNELAATYQDQMQSAGASAERLGEEIRVVTANSGLSKRDRQTSWALAVRLSTPTALAGVSLKLTYQVSEADWSPGYQLAVSSRDESLAKFRYSGHISQRSGEDWDEVNLALSSGRLNLSTKDGTRRSAWRSDDECGQSPDDDDCEEGFTDGDDFRQNYPTAEVTETRGASKFQISGRTTITSDESVTEVNIGNVDLRTELYYEAKSNHVYLMAKAKNTGQWEFLPGPVAVSYDGEDLGETKMVAVGLQEEFCWQLVTEPAIKVTWGQLEEFEEKLDAETVRTTTSQTIKVKNTRQEAVQVRMTRDLPRMTRDSEKFELTEPIPDGINAKRIDGNQLELKFTVEANEENKLDVVYKVTRKSDEDDDEGED